MRLISGEFTLYLWCENKDTKRLEPGFQTHDPQYHAVDEFPHRYVGETGAECINNAMREGWIIDEDSNHALCPKCSGLISWEEHANGMWNPTGYNYTK